MKKLIIILLTIFALTLTACGATDSAATTTVSQTDSAAGNLTGSTLLLLGTLKLDGTEQAITAEQAAELLPLWQVYQSLSVSGTAAQAEIDALVKQIQDTMTANQMKAISSLNLTQQDLMTAMQEQGVGPSMQSAGASDSSADNAFGGGMTPPDGGGGGGPMGGSPPDGGGDMPMGDAGGAPDMTTSDTSSAPAMNPGSQLISALIELLQTKIAS
jgi:hypothetical protein